MKVRLVDHQYHYAKCSHPRFPCECPAIAAELYASSAVAPTPTLDLARDLFECADAIESFAAQIRRIAGRLDRGADRDGMSAVGDGRGESPARASGPSTSTKKPDLREQVGAETDGRNPSRTEA